MYSIRSDNLIAKNKTKIKTFSQDLENVFASLIYVRSTFRFAPVMKCKK